MRGRIVALLGVLVLLPVGAHVAHAAGDRHATGIPGKPASVVQTQQILDLALDEGHGLLYAASSPGIVVFALPSLTRVATIDLDDVPVSLDLSPDRTMLAAARYFKGDILLVDTATRAVAGTLRPSSSQPLVVRFAGASRLYSSTFSDDILHVFDVPSRTEVGHSAPTGSVRSIALTADGTTLYTSESVVNGARIARYDVRTDIPVRSGATPNELVEPGDVAVKPDGSRVFWANGEAWSGDLRTRLGAVPGISARGGSLAYAVGGDAVVIADHPLGDMPFIARANGTSLNTTGLRHAQLGALAVNDAGTVVYAATGTSSLGQLESFDFAAPDAPTSIIARAGIGSAVVSWTPPADTGSSPITGYEVMSENGDRVAVGAGATSALLTGLLAAQQEFMVVAVNASQNGPLARSGAVRPEPGGTYHPMTPARILDTRIGLGSPRAPMGPDSTLTVTVAGRGGVPSDLTQVSAVVMNVTVTDTTDFSHLTMYPSTAVFPLASALNWAPGQTVANLIVLSLGGDGAVSMYNRGGQANVLFDVAGWVGTSHNSTGPSGMFNALAPSRLLDTRTTGGPIGPGETRSLRVTGAGGVPSSGVSAVVLNLTVTDPTQSSFVAVWPAGEARPTVSNVNFQLNQTRANRVMVKVGAGGMVNVYNDHGSTQVVVDVGGWYTDATSTAGGSGLAAKERPSRLFDTRDPGNSRLLPGGILELQSGEIPPNTAVILNVTAVDATAPTFLTLFPAGQTPPLASDLNLRPGETVPNLTVVRLDDPVNRAFATLDDPHGGAVNVVFDVYGIYGGVVQPLTAQGGRSG